MKCFARLHNTVTLAKTRTRTAQSEYERANHKALTRLGVGGNLKIERTQKMIRDCTEEHKKLRQSFCHARHC